MFVARSVFNPMSELCKGAVNRRPGDRASNWKRRHRQIEKNRKKYHFFFRKYSSKKKSFVFEKKNRIYLKNVSRKTKKEILEKTKKSKHFGSMRAVNHQPGYRPGDS